MKGHQRRGEIDMAKRCRNCDYGDCGDMCRFWRVWKKQVPLKYCSEDFINELRKEGVVRYNALITPTQILDYPKFSEISQKFFFEAGREGV
jgi:hypothetical protein